MRAISTEKRELIIQAKHRGEKNAEIAKWLYIHKETVSRIWIRYSKTGSLLPIKNKGRISSVSAEKRAEIEVFLEKKPDSTLAEIIEKLSLPIKKSQLDRLLVSLGNSRKKKQLTRNNKIVKKSKKNARIS